MADTRESLHAPALLPYEAANALTRLIAAEALPAEALGEAWAAIERAPYHPLEDGPATGELALRLAHRIAYDAAYVALAVALDARSCGHSTARSRVMRPSAGCPRA